MKIFNNINNWSFLLLAILILSSCKDKIIGENPYDGGEPPLGIKFELLNRKLDPVRPGETVVIPVRGLLNQPESTINVLVNEQEAELVSRSDSTMTIRVPSESTSGIVKLLVGNQIFFGPRIMVEGKTKVDIYFETGKGFNGGVYAILPYNNNYLVGGEFTNYKDEAEWEKSFRNRIHLINESGHSQGSGIGRGIDNGYIQEIKRLLDGRLIICGDFRSYDKRETGGIAILTSNGGLATKVVDVINADPNNAANSKDTVSAFNGQFVGGVTNIYPLKDSLSILAIGNFIEHRSVVYSFSSKFTRVYSPSRVRNVARLYLDGSIDLTYQSNNTGINGSIVGSAQLSNGKIIIIGAFTQYNGRPARNILVLNADGTIDPSFAGSGANGWIESIHYNSNTKKIGLAGRFTEYNGKKVNGAIMLNEDGSVVDEFEFKDTEGRFPNKIHLMDNGKVFVSGTFKKYGGVNRSQFLILEPSGIALQDYNHLGGFSGIVYSVVETKSSEGFPALLLGGYFNTIEGLTAGSIVRIEIKN